MAGCSMRSLKLARSTGAYAGELKDDVLLDASCTRAAWLWACPVQGPPPQHPALASEEFAELFELRSSGRDGCGGAAARQRIHVD